MRQYKGGVCFIDLLGIGALTRKQVSLSNADYIAHGISKVQFHTEQRFCAILLMKFRKVLWAIQKTYPKVQVAQLSDSAFLWSEHPQSLANAVAACMWMCMGEGLLSRGGMAFGDIIEPDKVNSKIGRFVLGEAVTKAVQMEGAGKGCRIFSDVDLPSELSPFLAQLHPEVFVGLKNPLDGSVTDEFRWYLIGEAGVRKRSQNEDKRSHAVLGLLKLICLLRYSPLYGWNASSPMGEVHIATSIESISSCVRLFVNTLDYQFNSESLIGYLGTRGNDINRRIYTKFEAELEEIIAASTTSGKTKKLKKRENYFELTARK